MCVLISIISFVVGGAFGVTMMCLFRINRINGNAKFEDEPMQNGGK